jgi:hypothetical protein
MSHGLVIRSYGPLCPYCGPAGLHMACAGHAMLNGAESKRIDMDRLQKAREDNTTQARGGQ